MIVFSFYFIWHYFPQIMNIGSCNYTQSGREKASGMNKPAASVRLI